MPKGHSLIGAYNAQMVRRGSQPPKPTSAPPPPPLDWTFQSLGARHTVTSVYFGDTWVVGTSSGLIARLSDLTDYSIWESFDLNSLPGITNAYITSVYYAGGYWVFGDYTNGYWYTDNITDFSTYTNVSCAGVNSITYNSTLGFIFAAKDGSILFRSDKDITLAPTENTKLTTSPNIKEVTSVFSNGTHIVAGDVGGSVYYCDADGNYSGEKVLDSGQSINSVYFSNGMWVAATASGKVFSADPSDFTTWTTVYNIGTSISSMYNVDKRWFFTSDNKIYSSPTLGDTLTSTTLPNQRVSISPYITSIHFGDGKLMVGDSDSLGVWYK